MDVHEPSYAATVAHRIATVALVVSVLFTAFHAVQLATGRDGDVDFAAIALVDQGSIAAGIELSDLTNDDFRVVNPSARESRLSAADGLLLGLLLAGLTFLLRGMTRSARDGDPFVEANVRRLRGIGVRLVIGSVAVAIGRDLIGDAIADPYLLPNLATGPGPGLFEAADSFFGAELFTGLAAIVLAQVFAAGVRLHDDVDATI